MEPQGLYKLGLVTVLVCLEYEFSATKTPNPPRGGLETPPARGFVICVEEILISGYAILLFPYELRVLRGLS